MPNPNLVVVCCMNCQNFDPTERLCHFGPPSVGGTHLYSGLIDSPNTWWCSKFVKGPMLGGTLV